MLTKIKAVYHTPLPQTKKYRYNRVMKNLTLKTILSFLILFPLYAGPAVFKGKAIEAKSGQPIYLEDHKVEYNGPLVKKVITIYLSPDGKEIARLTSIFADNSQLPNTEFIDKRTGYKEITTLKGDEYHIKTISPKGKEKEGSLSVKNNLVCGQGYHNYIISNMDSFKLNETRELRFIIPSMRDYFTFDLTYLGPLNKEKPDEVSFRLDITNWIIKMFADKIQVTYSKKDKVLLRYEGLTNLKNDKGDQYDAILTYTFPEGR